MDQVDDGVGGTEFWLMSVHGPAKDPPEDVDSAERGGAVFFLDWSFAHQPAGRGAGARLSIDWSCDERVLVSVSAEFPLNPASERLGT